MQEKKRKKKMKAHLHLSVTPTDGIRFDQRRKQEKISLKTGNLAKKSEHKKKKTKI